MEYRLLGELEVVGDDGTELSVRGVKQRALLLTQKVGPLPPGYPDAALVVHLQFEYSR